MVDARDSKSRGPCAHESSILSSGTNEIKYLGDRNTPNTSTTRLLAGNTAGSLFGWGFVAISIIIFGLLVIKLVTV